MKAKFCPRCENTDLIMVAGAEIGLLQCKVCDFESSLFPEREIKLSNHKKLK
ncbi:MAG: hypothetical protein WDZ77_02505 [Candidatus Pacearchaeota archaeon]